MAVKKISTRGYRGARTGGRYLPAGEYSVGDRLDIARRVVPEALARYMVSIGLAVGLADFDAEPDAAGEIATKVVGVEDGRVKPQRRTAKRGRGKRTVK